MAENGFKRAKLLSNKHNGNASWEAEGEGLDRLSSLPDSLLIEVLSILPIRSAVATSTLSHRWRHMWPQMTRFKFVYDFFARSCDDIFSCRATEFFNIMDHVLRQLTAPKIHRFELVYHYHPDTSYKCPPVEPRLRQVCARNAEEIKVEFICYRGGLLPMPPYIFQCESLVSLCLGHMFDYKLHDPCDGILSISLPNLKKLDISLSDYHRELMALLFKSCPLLEYLRLGATMTGNDNLVDISSRKLRDLILSLHCEPFRSNNLVLINAPNLTHFSLSGSGCLYYRFVEHPCGLLETDMCVHGFGEDSLGYRSQTLEVVQGISSTRSLSLKNWSFNFLGYWRDSNMPIFLNLTKLSITLNYFDKCRNFLLFLHCLPNLEVLELSMEFEVEVMGEDVDWVTFEFTPACFSTSLRRINIESHEGSKDWDFLAYLLRIAKVLELLNVTTSNYVELNKEFELCRDLLCYPRSSAACEIEFDGAHFSASSKRFNNGSLDSLILRCSPCTT